MNFIDYCAYTKNYSALEAIRCFAESKEKKKKDKDEVHNIATKEGDENFWTLIKNKAKRLGAGLLVGAPLIAAAYYLGGEDKAKDIGLRVATNQLS